ncbi:MAG: MvdC/MvdD family ATP grasp protein [Planctomycetota bacterium]
MPKTVLLLTHTADHFVIERVAEALAQRGARAFRFDTDLFPGEARLSARAGPGSGHRLACGGREINLEEVGAVWVRKIWTPRLDERLDPQMREGALRESAAALAGFLDGLHGARWIDPPDAVRQAANKMHQLRFAGEVGLDVPRTLMTNDPEAVRAFRAEHGPIVAKMLTPLSFGMESQPFSVRTSLVRDADLDHLDSLRHAPMVFQELVEKQVELRVACVGARAFAGEIDASRSERGKIDWRAARPGEVRWAPGALPEDIAERLRALLGRLGLRQGAVDLIRTPQGRHVFLEVNPVGEWGMLERDLGLPISEAIAEELLADDEVPS